MKKQKTLGFALLVSATMLLAACGGGNTDAGKSTGKSTAGHSTAVTSEEEVELPKYNVVIKGADGAEISKEEIELRKAITKPADPTAPAGQTFLGWKNIKNGGQMWDFEEDHKLNKVMGDVELVPVFVPTATATAQVFEAELCPEITEANDGTGMDGATYSGGAKGKQFVGRTYDGEAGATTISSYDYIAAYDNEEEKEDDVVDGYYCLYEQDKIPNRSERDANGKTVYDTVNVVDENGSQVIDSTTNQPKTKKVARRTNQPQITEQKHAEVDFSGAVVHFNYNKGNVLSFELNSDVAATGVSLFGRFSAEYGKPFAGDGFEDTIDSFSDEDFLVKVNGTEMKYGDIAIHNIVGTSGAEYIYCQDYYMGNIDLVAGKNTIELVVNNNKTLNGTIAASAPVIDSVKLYSSSTLTWPTAKVTNLVRG